MTKKIQKQLFTLQGKSNTGKTITLGKLHNEFVPSKMKVIADSFTEIGNDFCTILEFKEMRIGITTHGAKQEDLKPVLEHFKEENCKIIICECHPDVYIKMNGKKSYSDIKIGYLKDYKQTIVNKHCAKRGQSVNKVNSDDAEQLMLWVMREFIIGDIE